MVLVRNDPEPNSVRLQLFFEHGQRRNFSAFKQTGPKLNKTKVETKISTLIFAIMAGSTSMLELKVNNKMLENIVDMYRCVDPRLVAIKLDKLVSGLPFSFSKIQFCSSRTPNYSTSYEFQCFLKKATSAAETSSTWRSDRPDLVRFFRCVCLPEWTELPE